MIWGLNPKPNNKLKAAGKFPWLLAFFWDWGLRLEYMAEYVSHQSYFNDSYVEFVVYAF